VKAKEENDMLKKRLAELQMQAAAMQAAGSQTKSKAADLTAAIVSIMRKYCCKLVILSLYCEFC